eukprot:TRINITY_DN4555_c0_g1_i10.p1 TRINITY_DN4555_c0_g1~~TRINITY_DN4555_c0_g1_i10.p1  ORF type:complete len:523 (+),score=75.85 TRINITY_DN4555_c0_g1_i10:209-1570(+)
MFDDDDIDNFGEAKDLDDIVDDKDFDDLDLGADIVDDGTNFVDVQPIKPDLEEPVNKKLKQLKDHEVQLSKTSYACKLCDIVFHSRAKLLVHRRKHKLEVPGKFSCDTCDKVFEYDKDLVKHKIKAHKGEYVCDICKAVLHSKKKYYIHTKWHDGYKCEECGKQHATYRHLYQHKAAHKNKLRCPHCPSFFRYERLLASHLLKHDPTAPPPKKHLCTDCGKKFRCPSELNLHREKIHMPQIKTMSCEFCGKTFSHQESLRNHLRTHREKKKPEYLCSTCNRAFFKEKERAAHICKHYSCDECDMKFVQERNLKLHKRTHAGETMLSCPLCEALFERKKNLNNHKNQTHSETRRFACTECPKAFKTRTGLTQHMVWHRGERPFKCDDCDMSFRTKTHLKSHGHVHGREHPFSCDSCGLGFRSSARLREHREKKKCGVTTSDFYENGQDEKEAVE